MPHQAFSRKLSFLESRPFRQLQLILLPRPQGLLHKGEFFWVGYVIAFPFTDWAQTFSPALSLLKGIGYFFVLEILLQQAKFLWNDFRDASNDSKIPRNSDRLFNVGSPFRAQTTRVLIFVRWSIALLLGLI